MTIQTRPSNEYAIGETVTISVLSDSRYNCNELCHHGPARARRHRRGRSSTLCRFADLPNAGVAAPSSPDTYGATESGNTVTILTKTPHFLNVGDTVTIAGMLVTQ